MIRVRARIYYPAYPLLILCILLALCSPAWGALAKESLAMGDYYRGTWPATASTKPPWLPQPDTNEGVVFYETLEYDGTVENGFDYYTTWTCSGCDAEEATVTHTDHGIHVLEIASGSGAGNYASYDIGSAASGIFRGYFRLDTWPTVDRNFLYIRNGANNAMRLLADNTLGLRAVIPANSGANNKSCYIQACGTAPCIAVDTWYRVEMNVKAAVPTVRVWDDSGNAIAWTTGGKTGDTNICCTSATDTNCGNNYNPDYSAFDVMLLGDDASVAAAHTAYYDDIVVRQYDAEVGDWDANDFVATADGDKYYTSADATATNYLAFTHAAATESDTLKGFRVWGRFKQYDENTYKNQLFAKYTSTPGEKTYLSELTASSSFKDFYYNFIATDYHDQHNKQAPISNTMAWDDIPMPVGVVATANDIMGGKVDKLWVEIIRGASGDAYVTHEPYFGGVTDSSIKVWVRVNEATGIKIVYGTNETYVKANTGGDTAITSAVDVTSTTDFSTIFDITGLSANTKYYFDVQVQQADDSWLSTYAFENPENVYWDNLPYCYTNPTDGTATDYHYIASGDWHDQPAHHELWKAAYDKGAKFLFDLGDQYILDNISAGGWTESDYDEINAIIYDRRGFHADASWYSQYISSRMPVYRMWSDHDGPGINNNNKVGGFDYDEAASFTPGFRSWVAFKRTQPMPPLYVDTDLGECIYDNASCTDMDVTTADATGLIFKTTDTVPMTGTTGVYPGMVLINQENGDPSWGIVRNVVFNDPTYEVYLVEPLQGGTTNGFDLNDAVTIQRGMLANKFTYGNTEFISADVRRKRDPNGTPGIDKVDGTSYPFQALLISKDINADGTFGDYFAPQAGSTETLIYHNQASLLGGTTRDDATIWDLVQVSSPKVAADFAVLSGSIYCTSATYPMKPVDVHRVITSGGSTKLIYEVYKQSLLDTISEWWYDETNQKVCIYTTSYIDADHPVEIIRGYSLAKSLTNSPQPSLAYFDSASNPADNGTLASATVDITPPASMLAGDLIIVVGEVRSITSNITIAGGGQTWYDGSGSSCTGSTQVTGATTRTLLCWATFNGSWTGSPANPRVSFSGTIAATTGVMHVFRPSSTSSTWSVDVNEVASSYAAPVSPCTVTITGITTVADNSLAVAVWGSRDDNSWGSLGGWTQNLGGAQYRNTNGQDDSLTFAYKINGTAGATGNVSKNQTVNGCDPGTKHIIAFKESLPVAALGNLELEWAIDNISTSDRVRIYESGASDWGNDATNINHGHVQRTFLEAALRDDSADWKVMLQETPLKGEEIMQRDKWGDSDGMAMWRKLVYDGTADDDWTQPTDANCTALDTPWDCCTDEGTGTCDAETCSGAVYASNWTFTDSSGTAVKPGGLFSFYDPGNMDDSGARDGALVEVSTFAGLVNAGHWYWDATNKKVYICDPADLDATYPVMVFRPNFWERSSSRKYILEKYGSLNVYDLSADRHFGSLDDAANSYDPWPTAGCSPTHVDTGSHFCGKKWQVNGSNSWYDSGMGWVPSYSSPGFDNTRQGGFCDVNVQNGESKVTITLCERNGQTITNNPAVNTENTQDEWIGDTWLGNMTMDVQWIIPPGYPNVILRGTMRGLGGGLR